MAPLLLVAIAAAVAMLVEAERSGRHRALWKILASTSTAALPFVLGLVDSYGWLIAAGLIMSALGDVALLGASSSSFLLGLSAFVSAHLTYTVAFASTGPRMLPLLGAGLVLAVIGVVVGRWLLPRVADDLRRPVLLYMAVITFMLAAAVAASAVTGDWRIGVGAGLFYASDLAVARNRFIAPRWVDKAWGLPAYYAGQVVLAFTV